MDDKTLQPSPSFDDSSSTQLRSLSRQATLTITSSSALPSALPSPRSYPSTSIHAIISGNNRPNAMDRKNPMDIKSIFLSPPEAPAQDSFSQPPFDSKMKHVYLTPNGRFNAPLSPPVSPESTSNVPDSPSNGVRDPILFPSQDIQATAASQPPLFYDAHTQQRVVDEHVLARKSSMFRAASPPRPADYHIALEFKSQMVKHVIDHPRLFLRRELAFLKEDDARRQGRRIYAPILPASSGPRKSNGNRIGPRVNASGGVTKPPRQPKVMKPREGTPEGGAKRVAREDKDFNSLPDYCPPLSSLADKKTNALKVDWKGAPIDLKFDPHAHLLHPDELALAANLRLDCATYLTSKRRVFMKRIEALKIGKEFRKTDAQQACKIDVNKASKLWQAFDKVGWLYPHWVQKYL